MKNTRFYLESKNKTDKKNGVHEGNVFAADIRDDGNFEWYMSGNEAVVGGVGAVYFHPNSAVASTSYSIDLLHERCKRISEAKARQVHPRLFEYLDEGE